MKKIEQKRQMKKYETPKACPISITAADIIASSGLDYSDESADKEIEVLSGKKRGEWGNIWKQ